MGTRLGVLLVCGLTAACGRGSPGADSDAGNDPTGRDAAGGDRGVDLLAGQDHVSDTADVPAPPTDVGVRDATAADLATMETAPALPPGSPPPGCDAFGTGPVMSLAYSPDGALLAVGTNFGAVELYRTSDRTLTGTRWVGFRPVVSVAFSPDGAQLVAVASDEAVRVFRASGEPAPLATLSLSAREAGPLVRGAVFTGDGNQLLVPHGVKGEDLYLGRFRASDGQPVSRQRLGPASPTSIMTSPDRKWYVTVGASEPARAIVLRSASDDATAASIPIGLEATAAFSRDSTLMVAGPDTTIRVKVIRLADAAEVAAVPMDRVLSLALSPDNKSLYVGQAGMNSLDPPKLLFQSFDGTGLSGHITRKFGGGNLSLALSPDGKSLASADNYTVAFLDPSTINTQAVLPSPTENVNDLLHDVAFAPDGSSLVLFRRQGLVFWSLAERRTWTLPVGTNLYRAIAFSPDSTRLGVASNVIRVMTAKGESLWQSELRLDPMSVAFSPDGTSVATCYGTGSFQIFDAASGASKHLGSRPTPGVSHCPVAFSADGTELAVGGNVAEVIDTRTFAKRRDLPPRVVALAYSPDGKLLAVSTSQDIALLATDTGSPVRRLPFAGPSRLSFTGDSTLLAATGQVHTNVRVFRVADGSVVDGLLATRNMADFSRGTHRLALVTESSSAVAVLCGLK